MNEDYFAELRHDLYNPINQIIGFSELIEEDFAEEQTFSLEDLHKIRAAAEMLSSLVKTRVKPSSNLSLSERPLSNIETGEKPLPAKAFKDDLSHSLTDIEAQNINKDMPFGKVLAVDDDGFNLDILAKFLHKQGHVVTTAEDGLEALDILSKTSFDLILLDVMMPNLDGFETLKRIKEQENLLSTPVIMISALDELSSVIKCIECGAEDYLPKPYNSTLLRARVGACLERKAWVDRHLDLIDKLEESQKIIDAEIKNSEAQLEILHDKYQGVVDVIPLVDAFARMNASLVGQRRQIAETLQDVQIKINRTKVSAQVRTIISNPQFSSLSDRAKAMRARRKQREQQALGGSSATMEDS
ncbi:MAG: response regulator [Synechococcus sp. s2_metabat2_7]|nr:response regulator [Synechococcus sp. s2_metabat2_7]